MVIAKVNPLEKVIRAAGLVVFQVNKFAAGILWIKRLVFLDLLDLIFMLPSIFVGDVDLMAYFQGGKFLAG